MFQAPSMTTCEPYQRPQGEDVHMLDVKGRNRTVRNMVLQTRRLENEIRHRRCHGIQARKKPIEIKHMLDYVSGVDEVDRLKSIFGNLASEEFLANVETALPCDRGILPVGLECVCP